MDDEKKTLEHLKEDMEIDEEISDLKGQITAIGNNQNHLWCSLVATIGAVIILLIVDAFKHKT